MDSEHLTEDEQRWEEAARPAEVRFSAASLQEPISILHPPVPTCVRPGTPLGEAIRLMQSLRTGCVLVVDGKDLRAILTERDLLLKLHGQTRVSPEDPLERIATPNPEVLRETDSIAYALNKMAVGGYRHIPLVDQENRPTGLLSMRMIIQYLADFFPERVLNLPPEPTKNGTKRYGG